MAERIITTPAEMELWIKFLRSRRLPPTVAANDGRDRTREQNRLMWLWATEAAHQRGDVTSDEVQREWKLRHGVPILREDGASFRDTYDRLIKDEMPYEAQLELMRFISVTSLMNVRQMVRFHDAVARECAENGIKLTAPDPELASYQSRYRTEREAA